MKRIAAAVLCCVLLGACSDDRVTLTRGPLGPASYEVEVSAQGEVTDLNEEHRATLRIEPSDDGARFVLRTSPGEIVTADLSLRSNGSVDLTRVRGVPVEGAGQTELASLVGQLNPPLPRRPVRLGDGWSSTQKIRTDAFEASLRTKLRLVRFRRIASTDAAELRGEVTGDLEVTDASRVLRGKLIGRTQILWAVRSGRVTAADTQLVWELSDGTRVSLQTSVQPR